MLMRTRGQSSFQSSISELYLARFFLEKGGNVTGFDENKGNDRVPEFLVSFGAESIVCEVSRRGGGRPLRLFEDELP